MKTINIKSKSGSYQVVFKENLNLPKEENKGFFLIDETILKLYKKNLNTKNYISIKANESAKTLEFAKKIYLKLLLSNFRKNDRIIAVGGGVIQDIAGFVSSTIYRGVKWTYIPTTLLAQTDSCIGGKTSINIENYKNIIGTFYPPEKIVVVNKFLKTLKNNEIKSGTGELTKLLILGWGKETRKDLIHLSKNYEKQSFNFGPYIYKSLIIKKDFIERDELDSSLRNLLNYGHTLGHALESVSGFKISHGVAIIHGMIFANIIAKNRNLIEDPLFNFLNENILNKLIISSKSFKNFDMKKLMNICKKDKKVVGDSMSFVLPRGNLGFIKVNNVSNSEFKTAFNIFIKNV